MAHNLTFPPMETTNVKCVDEMLRTASCENNLPEASKVVPDSTLKILLYKVDQMSAYTKHLSFVMTLFLFTLHL